jgi:hypothetical protein
MVVAVFSGMRTSTPVTVSQLYCDSCGGVNMTKVRCSYSKVEGLHSRVLWETFQYRWENPVLQVL